jgi:hypothetical protein
LQTYVFYGEKSRICNNEIFSGRKIQVFGEKVRLANATL